MIHLNSTCAPELCLYICVLYIFLPRTCLHWACKRNQKHIVAYLLNSGADKEILTAKDELAFQLTSKPEIRKLLGGMLSDSNQNVYPVSPVCAGTVVPEQV